VEFSSHSLEPLQSDDAICQPAERPVELRNDDVIARLETAKQSTASLAIVDGHLAGLRRVHEERDVAELMERGILFHLLPLDFGRVLLVSRRGSTVAVNAWFVTHESSSLCNASYMSMRSASPRSFMYHTLGQNCCLSMYALTLCAHLPPSRHCTTGPLCSKPFS